VVENIDHDFFSKLGADMGNFNRNLLTLISENEAGA
jgi:hypothetical protein